MTVYFVIESEVNDDNVYQQYLDQVSSIIKKYDGKYLVRGGKVTPMGSDWKPERIIIIEFPAEENIFNWLSSPEYLKIASLREIGAHTKAIIIEGINGEENNS
jgi:uncharacterized protein (DUF1330 family)